MNYDAIITIFIQEFGIELKSHEEVFFKYLEDVDDLEYISIKSQFDLEGNLNDIFWLKGSEIKSKSGRIWANQIFNNQNFTINPPSFVLSFNSSIAHANIIVVKQKSAHMMGHSVTPRLHFGGADRMQFSPVNKQEFLNNKSMAIDKFHPQEAKVNISNTLDRSEEIL